MRTVLCPVDFSELSASVLRSAAALADRLGARLTVVHVNDPLLVNAAVAAYNMDLLGEQTRADLREFVASTILGVGGEAPEPTIVVVAGKPAREILNVARRERADLIVMGTHGLSRLRTVFFGSTTARVLRHTHVPVLALPTAGTEGFWVERRPPTARLSASSERHLKSAM